MNNRHRRVARIKAQEQKRFIKQVVIEYKAIDEVMTAIADSYVVFRDNLVKVANRIARDVKEALRK